MTIDERLDRLTERHEALSEKVQIVTAIERGNEEKLAQVMEAINALARIAEIQGGRLEDLEARV